jgi:hypothetical protein
VASARDCLYSANRAGDQPSNTHLVCVFMQMPKHRKLVDRRASKGRKIRFNVMEKLVNFMDPLDVYEAGDSNRVAALYSNLFGQHSAT